MVRTAVHTWNSGYKRRSSPSSSHLCAMYKDETSAIAMLHRSNSARSAPGKAHPALLVVADQREDLSTQHNVNQAVAAEDSLREGAPCQHVTPYCWSVPRRRTYAAIAIAEASHLDGYGSSLSDKMHKRELPRSTPRTDAPCNGGGAAICCRVKAEPGLVFEMWTRGNQPGDPVPDGQVFGPHRKLYAAHVGWRQIDG